MGDNLVTDVGDINVQTQGSIANIGDYSLAKDGNIKVTAGQEVINNGEYRINGNGSINVKATGVVTETEGEKTAAGGDIINFGNYYTKSGNITMTSHDDVLNYGVMEAVTGDISIISTDGVIFNGSGADLLSGNGNVTLRAESTNGYYYYFDAQGVLHLSLIHISEPTRPY